MKLHEGNPPQSTAGFPAPVSACGGTVLWMYGILVSDVHCTGNSIHPSTAKKDAGDDTGGSTNTTYAGCAEKDSSAVGETVTFSAVFPDAQLQANE